MSLKNSIIHRDKYQPFIKWVGGKRGLLSQILPLFPKEFEDYHEPFLGGGAVFFELYSRGLLRDKNIYLSDINKELINTYNIVKNSPLELIISLEEFKSKHNKEFYYKIREQDRQDNFKSLSDLQRATRFIYLNKTCFNGLYRVNRKGQYNTPIGSYKNPNIADSSVILRASEALQNAIIVNQSFDKVLDNAKAEDLVYFDPPYYPLNQTASFTAYNENIFLEERQKELFDIFKALDNKKCSVFHSNSDTVFIKELYNDYDINIVQANRFINSKASGRGKISEILVRNLNMNRREAIIKLKALVNNHELHNLADIYNVQIYNPNTNKVNKGWAGILFEKYLGLTPNSFQSPDFGSWELKSIPLKKLKNGNWTIKETMAITMIDENNIKQTEFKNSHLLSKLQKMLIVVRTVGENVDEPSYVHSIHEFDLDSDMYKIIENDYNLVRNTLLNNTNGFSLLTGKMGQYIQPRTKGAGHGSTSRAFYARTKFLKYIIL
ncbi:MAG: MvaI/BcnI family restriction endonuclease [Sulfurovum sp.]